MPFFFLTTARLKSPFFFGPFASPLISIFHPPLFFLRFIPLIFPCLGFPRGPAPPFPPTPFLRFILARPPECHSYFGGSPSLTCALLWFLIITFCPTEQVPVGGRGSRCFFLLAFHPDEDLGKLQAPGGRCGFLSRHHVSLTFLDEHPQAAVRRSICSTPSKARWRGPLPFFPLPPPPSPPTFFSGRWLAASWLRALLHTPSWSFFFSRPAFLSHLPFCWGVRKGPFPCSNCCRFFAALNFGFNPSSEKRGFFRASSMPFDRIHGPYLLFEVVAR